MEWRAVGKRDKHWREQSMHYEGMSPGTAGFRDLENEVDTGEPQACNSVSSSL